MKINKRKEYGHWETDLLFVGKYPICVSVECPILLLPSLRFLGKGHGGKLERTFTAILS